MRSIPLVGLDGHLGETWFLQNYDNNNSNNSVIIDRLCGLVVRVPNCRTEMYCDSYEVRTEFIYVM
jgi:hypothetical protein